MRALAKDLAETTRLYEYPLVRRDGENYIVFDGNRRVCCLKLLFDPKLSPSEKWLNFFSDLRSEHVAKAFSKVDCEVEADLSVIDEKLYRRHTGSQEGVGQSQWDAEGKSFFLVRTGKQSVGLGESIERALKAENLIKPDVNLPWSNLERLFSSEPIRKRAGFSFSGGSITHLGDRTKSLQTLKRIADDLAVRKVVLGDIWNNAQKTQYLDRLKTEGLPIDIATAPRVKTAAEFAASPTSARPSASRGRVPKDKYLISAADPNPFVEHPELERAEKIWRELQFTLQFDDHDNAIAVLMRVLLELAIVHYARRQGIVFSGADSFARRVSAVADSMLNRNFIDSKGRSIIRKFESDKPIVSAHSMHQYVHNANFHPARSDLRQSGM